MRPLYVSTSKLNYTTAIAHYFSIITVHPKLEKKLCYCSAFKIPNNINDPNNERHICFEFDEALETFGVRFIKQNINENIFDKKTLRDQIKISQDEKKRIDLLLSEYLGNYSISHSEQAVKSCKESLWKLVDDLIIEVLGIEYRNSKVAENSNEASPTTKFTEPQSKRRKTIDTKHRTTDNEIAILSVLKIYKNNLPNEVITSVCEKLSKV
ncbi:hypothetical protein Glove_522g81 [Diversispora epigaea]|uniref:Uncharacterized protein n=1 Tax=Diversispora epigaea TaxID=1348612 RepID=A0A397GEB0_9GLOM|nr:hypothetical protein Glove_522g81 [Diversispora epigaea]